MAIEIPTFDELYDRFRNAAQARSTRITSESFSPGYIWDVAAGTVAHVAQEILERAILQHNATFLKRAAGEDLDSLVQDHLGFSRQVGVAAVGRVQFSRASAPQLASVLIGAGTVVRTSAGGLRFLTTHDVLMTGTNAEAEVRAEVVGQAGNVEPGTLTKLVTPLADSAIGVSNQERTAGGRDREADPELRERALLYHQTLSRGTLKALEFAARNVPGVVYATASDESGLPAVFIADVTGQANQLIATAVHEALEDYRAAGVPVAVYAAVKVMVDIRLIITFRADGAAGIPTRQAITEAVVRAVNALRIGETLHKSAIIAAAMGVAPSIVNVVVDTPAGDVIPAAPYIVLRTEASRIEIA